MKANYPKRNPEGVYVKRTKDKNRKVENTKVKQNIKKNRTRISRKGIQ